MIKGKEAKDSPYIHESIDVMVKDFRSRISEFSKEALYVVI